MPSLDNYRLVRQMNRGYRQNQIERPTRESSTPPELIDANATRLDVLKSKTIVPVRTLGKKALDLLDGIYTAGLERNDPAAALVHKEAVQSKRQEAFEKAEALRQERAENLQAERKLAEEQAAAEQHDRHIEDVMNQVDLSKNTNPRILELMNGRFYPDNYMRDETATILYSRIFSESKNSDKNYLVAYHTLDDGELLPLLMRAGKDNQWAIDTSLLPESLIKLLPSEETLDPRAYYRVNGRYWYRLEEAIDAMSAGEIAEVLVTSARLAYGR